MTRTLIRLRANLEKPDASSGLTPLCEAVRKGNPEVIRVLCAAGADKDVVTKSGFSPLLLAVSNSQMESLKALCEAGVDKDKLYRLKIWDIAPGDLEGGGIEHSILSCILGEAAVRRQAKQNKGKHLAVWDYGTTLFASAFQNQPDMVQVLCEARADMNRATADHGITALFIAAVKGHEEVVRTLIHASADVRKRTSKTHITPAAAAARAKRGKVASLLAELADEDEDFTEPSDNKLEVHTFEEVLRRTEASWHALA